MIRTSTSPIDMPKWKEEIPQDLYPPYTISPEYTHTRDIVQTKQVLLGSIYVYTYMHTITTNAKRGHGFERKEGEVYRRVWGGGRERANDES